MVGENTARCSICATPLIIPDQMVLEWVEKVADPNVDATKGEYMEQTLEEGVVRACMKSGGTIASFKGEGVEVEIIIRYKEKS